MPNLLSLTGRLGHANVALITITTEEFDGVRAVFGLSDEHEGGPYAIAPHVSGDQYSVVLRRSSGQTNVMAAGLTADILEDFRPNFLFVIGTAGGHSEREGLRLGDAIIADYIEYSAYWKLNKGKYQERKLPFDHPSLHLREHYAEVLRRNSSKWTGQISASRPAAGVPSVLIGGVVAGEMLLGDAKNKEQRRILGKYEKALAFEMESFGIAQTVYRYRSSVHYNPQFLIVRGISDLVNTAPADNDEDRKRWTPYAINVAATFAKVLIERLLAREVPTEAGSGEECS